MSAGDLFDDLERPAARRPPTGWTGGLQPPERRRPPLTNEPDDTIDATAWADVCAFVLEDGLSPDERETFDAVARAIADGEDSVDPAATAELLSELIPLRAVQAALDAFPGTLYLDAATVRRRVLDRAMAIEQRRKRASA